MEGVAGIEIEERDLFCFSWAAARSYAAGEGIEPSLRHVLMPSARSGV